MSGIKILNLQTNNFKNLTDINLEFNPNLNLLIGDNAQGKTNLVENIWILTGCKSFRSSKENNLVKFRENGFNSTLFFENSYRKQKIEYNLLTTPKPQKLIKLNGVKIPNTRPLFEELKCVVFTPGDTEIISGMPEKRRWFIDLSASQLKTSSLSVLNRFNTVLMQRNSLIKKIRADMSGSKYDISPENSALFDVYDNQLSVEGNKISAIRLDYLEKFGPVVSELYSEITNNREKLTIGYRTSVTEGSYLRKLNESRISDLKVGYTTVGVNRDEFLININGHSARDFGSSGQKKSAALVMKLAQAQIFSKKTAEQPIILLDDVMGELDRSRQQLVFQIINGMQTFITACDIGVLNLSSGFSLFKVLGGQIHNS